ncbi:MAG: CocE/NonD family hydrolase [Pseudomonadota bacterium]|uniref:CocE/NonD family hydrolase n=1 Tax=Phenylobacterium sp. TaxID=1871053 RepID=UPI0025FEC849|nr:CocE/NonD family hydrolase [Phenylobacterium sp.]
MPDVMGGPINRRDLGVRFLQLAAFLALPSAAAAAVDKGQFDVVVRRNVMVVMRDGVRLATDIYLPAHGAEPAAGRFPVILERTPYGKSQDGVRHASAAIANMLASHGYVVVHQDCRGRGGSEGEYVKYLSDGADGYDCCAWLIAQPWCNGKIGAQGLSYGAHTVGALASANAPGVSALFIDSGGFSNAYQGGIRQGGAFELKQATWAYNAAFEAPEIRDDPAKTAALKAVDIRDWFARMPWSRGHSPLSLVPEYEDYVFDQWEAGDFNGFWKQLGIYAEGFYDQFSDAPMTWMSSWFDPYPRTATDNYIALSKAKRGPVRLILGPWTHGDNNKTFAGDVDFGPGSTLFGNLAPDLTTMRKRWFDRYLKGEANGVDKEPKVRIFVMGGGSGAKNAEGRMDHGGQWRAEADWPLPAARNAMFHLHGDGTLSEAAPAKGAKARAFKYDPKHPVPTIGGTVTSGKPVMVGGAFDQREGPDFFGSRAPYRPLAERPDVLVFQTPALDDDMEITGPIEADLWIASDCPDTDFTIKLIDVYPPNEDYPEGFAMNLTDGILRCRYRDSWEAPSLMTPGKAYKIKIAAFPTSNLFKRGHRIRLDISSSNFPHFDLNPNTGDPEGKWTKSRVATNKVFVDAARASSVTLPIIRRV